MTPILEEQGREIATKDLYQIVNVCCKDEGSSLNHGDAFIRYIGLRKKTVIYNNSESDIVILIKPLNSCFINKIKLGTFIDINIKDCNVTRDPIKSIITSKSYKKILVPTNSFSLTVYAKHVVEESDIDEDSDEELETPTQDASEFDYFGGVFDFFKNVVYDYGDNVKKIVKKGHRKLFSNNKWREVFTNKPFHTSHDIFVNERELVIMNRVTEVEYDDIGGDNNEKN